MNKSQVAELKQNCDTPHPNIDPYIGTYATRQAGRRVPRVGERARTTGLPVK
jgi:hypothetical protein